MGFPLTPTSTPTPAARSVRSAKDATKVTTASPAMTTWSKSMLLAMLLHFLSATPPVSFAFVPSPSVAFAWRAEAKLGSTAISNDRHSRYRSNIHDDRVLSQPRALHMVASTEVDRTPPSPGSGGDDDNDDSSLDMPELGPTGVYHIQNGDQHKAFIKATKDKMVVMKVFAPWCRACKALEPKFNAIVKDKQDKGLPIVFADFTIQHNKDYIKSIGVLALPTVQLYVHGGLHDNFPCGPSKVPILKRKLEQFVEQYVDQDSLTVIPQGASSIFDTSNKSDIASKDTSVSPSTNGAPATTVNATADAMMAKTPPIETVQGNSVITSEQRERIRQNSFLVDLTDDEFDNLMTKAKLLSFDAGSIIMREGNIGRTFYICLEGEVEICQKTSYEDPLSTPPTYLGTVINRLEAYDFFGERALITQEPRAASIRAASQYTKCLTFDKDDFPPSSILSGRSANIARTDADTMEKLQTADDKYGVNIRQYAASSNRQYGEIAKASQVRGSVNRPGVIAGVDTDDEWTDQDINLAVDGRTIIPLLMRFKLIRLVTRCFDYIMANRLRFGEEGSRRRRSMLLKLLNKKQIEEFSDAFMLIDKDGDGNITLMELRRIMDSIKEERSDDELARLLATGHGDKEMNYEDFMGLMAEAEFYYLFSETFQSLDTNNSGFVRAKDLDRVLCGIRDLISDDRKSIIDVEDNILIDYEQFSKMLLGTALK